MRAMIFKEFRQMTRNRRTLVLMFGMPLMMLIIFGYAARFDVDSIDTIVVGSSADAVASQLDGNSAFAIKYSDSNQTIDDARDALRNSEASVAVVAEGQDITALVDGTDLFVAQSALQQKPDGVRVEVLFNPELSTSSVMVPSLIGLILLFVGTVVTSLGVVREREQGTLEQLTVMPLRPLDIIVGKIAPYFLVAVFDMVMVTVAGIWLFDVPFVGQVWVLAAFGLVYLFVVLGLGVAISTVSQSQGEAVQLAIMVLLPQVMLSGMVFPLASMAAGVRWIGYLLPLTWFIVGMRGVFLKGSDLWVYVTPLSILVLMGAVIFTVAMVRFRKELAPARSAVKS